MPQAAATLPVAEMMAAIEEGPRNWPPGWAVWPETREAHIRLMERAIATCPEYPEGRFRGRGVVMGAGGHDRFVQAWVALSILRGTGCALPVEVWHLGAGEMDPTMRGLLESEFGARCVDAREVERIHPQRILNGFELKPFSLVHSRFREMLYLDCDNVALDDPERLFDCGPFRRDGAIFWPDLPPSDRAEWIPEACWHNIGLEPQPYRAIETGQIVLDKKRCWPALDLALWINNHSDYFYRFVYGDKDTFLLAWVKLRRSFATPSTLCSWCGVAIDQHDLEGRLLFQHRCGDKWRYDGANLEAPGFLRSEPCAAALASLRRCWHGEPWSWRDQTQEETAAAREAAGRYLYDRIGIGERRLELLPDGRIGEGRAGLERRWTLRLGGRAPLLAISGDNQATALLRPGGPGRWIGRWERFERGAVELRRLER